MQFIKLSTLILLPLLIGLGGCVKEQKQSRGLEQIHLEDGLPVETAVITPAPFSTWLLFNATLRGVEQTNTSAGLGARIVEVRAAVGDYVEQDQVIITFPIDHPMVHYDQARVGYENATAALERLEGLFGSGGVSQQELDNVRLQYDLAAANWDNARRAVEIQAPISGRITALAVRPTDNVAPDDLLFTVARTDSMRARIWLSEEEFLAVEPGAPATLIWQGESFNGSVIQIDQSLDRDHGGFGATLRFANRDDLLKPGVTAEIQVRTYHNPTALTVDFPYLVEDPIAGMVLFLAEGDRARQRRVTTGRRQGMLVEITDGLAAGEQLITTGQHMLEDGMRIRVQRGEE